MCNYSYVTTKAKNGKTKTTAYIKSTVKGKAKSKLKGSKYGQ